MSCPVNFVFAEHQVLGRIDECDMYANHAAEIRQEINRLRHSDSPWDHKQADELALRYLRPGVKR